jgi:hypothetical protein
MSGGAGAARAVCRDLGRKVSPWQHFGPMIASASGAGSGAPHYNGAAGAGRV